MESNNFPRESEEKIEKGVMDKIKSGQVKLHSRYLFLAEKLGLGSVFILSLLLAILFLAFLLSYLRASDNLIYLSFGSRGLFAFLESFPYFLVASFVVFIFLAGFIIKKSQVYYRKPFIYLTLCLLTFVLLLGSAMSFTSIKERFSRHPFSRQHFGYFGGPIGGNNARGLAGRVIGLDDQFIMIQTPSRVIKLRIPAISAEQLMALEPDQFVAAVGKGRGDQFTAEGFRVVGIDDMKIIRNGVMDKFGPVDPQACEAMRNARKCLGDCLLKEIIFELCRQRCLAR